MLVRLARAWLPLALVATVLAGTLYAVTQQVLRSGADDPQVELARDAAARLDAGEDAPPPGPPLDIARSPAPWVAVYDRSRHLVRSSATLDGQALDYPGSVLLGVAPGARHAVTWMPRAGVRQATVVVGWRDGWVVSGRSLEAVESREQSLALLVAAGWRVALGAAAAGAWLAAQPAFER